MARRWNDFWYRPEPAVNLEAARVLLALSALWVLLSRFDLPSVLNLPHPVWETVPIERRIRFLLVFGAGFERILYALLHVTLIAALLGRFERFSCFASGLLLYHFAPLETIIWTPNPYLRGFTIPTLGLLIIGFAGRGGHDAREASPDYRWPLALIQVLFCELYFFAGYSKLFTSGFEWLGADNIRRYLIVLDQFLGFDRGSSFGYPLVAHPVLCASIAWLGIALDLGFPIVLVWRRARWLVLPAALVFHIANAFVFHIFFQNFPLLLMFIDWTFVGRWRHKGDG